MDIPYTIMGASTSAVGLIGGAAADPPAGATADEPGRESASTSTASVEYADTEAAISGSGAGSTRNCCARQGDGFRSFQGTQPRQKPRNVRPNTSPVRQSKAAVMRDCECPQALPANGHWH